MDLLSYLKYLYEDEKRLLELNDEYQRIETELKDVRIIIPASEGGADIWNIDEEKGRKQLSESYLWSKVIPAQRDNDLDEHYPLLALTAHYFAYQEKLPKTYAFLTVPASPTSDHVEPDFDAIQDYLQRKFCTIAYKGLLYIYHNGQFCQNAGQIEAEFQQIMKFTGYTQKKRFKPVCDDVIHRLMIASVFTEYPFSDCVDVVPVNNGVITRFPHHKLLPKSPVWGMIYSLNVEYRPKEEIDTTVIETFFKSLVAPDDVHHLTIIPASSLFNGKFCYKSHLFVGRGSNGKSTYLRFLTSVFGEINLSSLSLNEMCNEKFKRAELVGKLMNICGDLPKKPVKNSDEYKKITGRDPITVERKHGQPFQIVSNAVMVFATNELPMVDDDSDGWWRRWDIIQFPHSFPVNPDFEDDILTEGNREAFLHLLLRAMDEIELYGTAESESMAEIRENWKCQSNSAYGYLRGNVEGSSTGVTLYDDLYRNYASWCDDEGLVTQTKTKFSDEVKKLFTVEKIRKGTRGGQQFFWRGIQYQTHEICPESECLFTSEDMIVRHQ